MIANFTLSESEIFDGFVKKHLQIEEFSIVPIAGDASSRKYYRISSEDNSWVLMHWEPFENPKEFPFLSIQSYMHQKGIEVPTIFAMDASRGLFILEDLGDLTLERRFWEFSKQNNALPFYQATLDQLIRLHRLMLLPHKDQECTAYSIAFDHEKFLWEMNYTHKNLLQTLCQQKLSPQDEQKIQQEYSDIARKLADLPQVICHRDFHSRNVMIKGERIVLIDFQDARKGPPQYDLVSLVHDSYVALSEDNKAQLIQYYLKEFPEVLKMFSSQKEFMHFFDLQTLQRTFKACGTFAAILNQRNDARYLKYLPGTLKTVKESLAKFPEYSQIQKQLENLQLPPIEKWP